MIVASSLKHNIPSLHHVDRTEKLAVKGCFQEVPLKTMDLHDDQKVTVKVCSQQDLTLHPTDTHHTDHNLRSREKGTYTLTHLY